MKTTMLYATLLVFLFIQCKEDVVSPVQTGDKNVTLKDTVKNICVIERTAQLVIKNESAACDMDIFLKTSGGKEKLGSVSNATQKQFTISSFYTNLGLGKVIAVPTCGKGLVSATALTFKSCAMTELPIKNLMPDFKTLNYDICELQEPLLSASTLEDALKTGSILIFKTAKGHIGVVEIQEKSDMFHINVRRFASAHGGYFESSHSIKENSLFSLVTGQVITVPFTNEDFKWEVVSTSPRLVAKFIPLNGSKFYLAN